MPSVKRDPCLNCKEKHVKCDQDGPQCRRCLAKGLECLHSARTTPFRPGSSAKYDRQFAGNQNWVNSSARKFRHHTSGTGLLRRHAQNTDTNLVRRRHSLVSPLASPSTELATVESHIGQASTTGASDGGFSQYNAFSQHSPHSTASLVSMTVDRNSTPCFSPNTVNLQQHHAHINSQQDSPNHVHEICEQGSTQTRHDLVGSAAIAHYEPLEDVQEACLVRYFVEELSIWFDTCDERKHFQILVPMYARRYKPLLNAILAVSARHLSRLPQYRTPQGILYHGQLLTNITPNSAVEYMLSCMPALREFHEIQDEERREHIIATAVILRQFEEMEMEEEEDETHYSTSVDENTRDGCTHQLVNFLAIENAVVRCSHLDSLFHREGLFNAAYWIALRQEVYYAFTRKHSLQMLPSPAVWLEANTANKMVMHAAQVAKWLWDDKSEQEWRRLKEQEGLLDEQVSGQWTPVYKRLPDKSKGEVFPTIWYGSELVVCGIQHLMIAKMVLMAESPLLRAQPIDRTANRKIESEVRSIVLDLCGIALHHPRLPPGLVNAIVGILLYGDFFTDQWDRKALESVVDKFKNVRAWPLPKELRSFK